MSDDRIWIEVTQSHLDDLYGSLETQRSLLAYALQVLDDLGFDPAEIAAAA